MKYILFILLFWPFSFVIAQDTIYTYKKQKISAQVIEIKNDQVAFKLSNSDDKSEYYLSKDEIAVIVYRDGKMESFSTKKIRNKSLRKTKSDTLKLGNNLLSMNVADVIFGQFTVNYERFLKSGYFSFKVPLSFGLYQIGGGNRIYIDETIYYSLNKIVSSGFSFNYYPFNQGCTTLFLGPSIETGLFKNIDYYTDGYYPGVKKMSLYASLQFHSGVNFAFNNHFQMSTCLGLGRNYEYNHYKIAIRLGLNVGYRF